MVNRDQTMPPKPMGRGRPPKPKPSQSEKPKKSAGRPRELLSADPERYFLAWVQFQIEIAPSRGVSALRVFETYASLRMGTPVNIVRREGDQVFLGDREKAIGDAHAGRGFHVMFDREQHTPLGRIGATEKSGSAWHEKNFFRPHAEALKRKLHRITHELAPDNHSRMWLKHMVLAWLECHRGTAEGFETAADLTARAHEFRYFETIMAPFMHHHLLNRTQDYYKPITVFDLIGIFVPGY